MNQNATPHPGERRAGRRSARAAVAARNCQTQTHDQGGQRGTGPRSPEENAALRGDGARAIRWFCRGVDLQTRSWWPNSRYADALDTMKIRLAKAVTAGEGDGDPGQRGDPELVGHQIPGVGGACGTHGRCGAVAVGGGGGGSARRSRRGGAGGGAGPQGRAVASVQA